LEGHIDPAQRAWFVTCDEADTINTEKSDADIVDIVFHSSTAFHCFL